jgi:transcription elongation GreA/GreB family factor
VTYLFLPDDHAQLQRRMDEAHERMRAAMSMIHETTTYSSESYHDNPAFDEQQQQAKMWHDQYQKLRQVLGDSQVVQPAAGSIVVELGSRVTFVDLATGEQDTLSIGSYLSFGADREDRVSYAAPLGALLLGAGVGDERHGRVGPGTRRVRIVRIEPAVPTPADRPT